MIPTPLDLTDEFLEGDLHEPRILRELDAQMSQMREDWILATTARPNPLILRGLGASSVDEIAAADGIEEAPRPADRARHIHRERKEREALIKEVRERPRRPVAGH